MLNTTGAGSGTRGERSLLAVAPRTAFPADFPLRKKYDASGDIDESFAPAEVTGRRCLALTALPDVARGEVSRTFGCAACGCQLWLGRTPTRPELPAVSIWSEREGRSLALSLWPGWL